MTLTLPAIAAELAATTGARFHVDNIGGGVAALVDYAGTTITLNGGQAAVDTAADGPAEVLVCFDGGSAHDVTGTATTAAQAAALLPAPARTAPVVVRGLTRGADGSLRVGDRSAELRERRAAERRQATDETAAALLAVPDETTARALVVARLAEIRAELAQLADALDPGTPEGHRAARAFHALTD